MQVVVFDRVLCWSAVAVAMVVFGGAALERQLMEAEQEADAARAIVAEDRAVCGRFGAEPGTELFSHCVIELSWVRSEERRRAAARAAVLP